MPTPVTSATSYLSAADLLAHADWRTVADWCSDEDLPRPTRASLLDSTSTAGALLAARLLAASGELESYCLRGGRYTPADLAALTGSTREYLRDVVAGVTLWGLARRRNPASADPKSVPGAQVALDALEALRLGERIFGLEAQVDAGAGSEAVEFVTADDTDPRRTVYAASRYFGSRADRG